DPPNAPARMPTRVIPIWTVARNSPGSSVSFIAARAPRVPLSASAFSRPRRDETTASSDIARSPFRTIRARMTAMSTNRMPLLCRQRAPRTIARRCGNRSPDVAAAFHATARSVGAALRSLGGGCHRHSGRPGYLAHDLRLPVEIGLRHARIAGQNDQMIERVLRRFRLQVRPLRRGGYGL